MLDQYLEDLENRLIIRNDILKLMPFYDINHLITDMDTDAR